MAQNRLVGREDELARLLAELGELEDGTPTVLALVGEAGIGKSRLMAELGARADEERRLLFSGRAAEFEQELPFGVFVDALDPYLGTFNPSRLRGLGAEACSELGAIFPGLAGIAGDEAGTLQHERYRAHHAVRSLLEMLGRDRGCVVLLDDMHWADPASLELLAHLLRRRPRAPVLIALAFRPPQAPPPLRAALERAERDGGAERIELQPLSAGQAALLLEDLDPRTRETVYRESGGNPFYLEQLARAVAREPRGDQAAGPGQGVPASVSDALAGELAELREPTRVVLQGAAVVGDPFSPELAAIAASVSEPEALAALDELLDLDLVRHGLTPLDFRFRHPIVRRAVYEGAPGGWELAAHGRLAGALAGRGETLAAAPHVARSAHAGEEEAIALLTEAGDLTAPRAPATAARWYDVALRLLPEGGEEERRLVLLISLARALGSSGRLEASRETLRQALAMLPPEAAPVRGQMIAFMSLIDHLLGRHGEARATLLAAVEDLPPGPTAESAALEAELAADCFFLGEWEEMAERAEAAVRTARTIGDVHTEAAALALLGLASYELTDVDGARRNVAAASRLVDALSDEELALRIDACHWLGWCEHLIDHYDDSIAHMSRGIAISRATGQGHVLGPMTIGLVISHTWRGDLAAAATHTEEAIEIAHLAGSDQLLAWSLMMQCWVAGRKGDVEEAIAAGEEAQRAAERVTRGPYSVVAACWLAEARFEAGEPQRARAGLLAAIDGPELPEVEPAFRSCVYELLTRTELALDEVEAAEAWERRAAGSVEGLDLPGREAFAMRAAAEVALARGEHERAAELGLAAAAAAGDGYRIEAARARALAGRALAAAGDTRTAVRELERARDELDACGALRFRDQADRALRGLGRRIARVGVRGSGESGLGSLSGRELEVAKLVTDRFTNREIAERLVISEKTVERHLSRIFGKLGVSSRVEVARALEAADAEAAALG
jgi:ATP/maltotriose-dependent transcriptional regulator MalT